MADSAARRILKSDLASGSPRKVALDPDSSRIVFREGNRKSRFLWDSFRMGCLLLV